MSHSGPCGLGAAAVVRLTPLDSRATVGATEYLASKLAAVKMRDESAGQEGTRLAGAVLLGRSFARIRNARTTYGLWT